MANKVRKYNKKPLDLTLMVLFLSIFQIFSSSQVVFESDGKLNKELAIILGGYILLEWLYFIVTKAIFRKKSFELELIAFFLSGIGLVVVSSVYPQMVIKQFIAIVIGLATFIVMTWFMGNINRVMPMRMTVAVLVVALLVLNLVLAKAIHGALNWITIGPVSFQPSEIAKVGFIFASAATLESIQSTRSLTKYILFALACIGALFLMYDFGAALIFFVTFLIIAFMRSGDIRTIILVCVSALLCAVLILLFRPYVAERFSTYRHIWENIDGSGYQQTRVLIYIASGGLFGVGIGSGKLKDVFAATTDLIFGIICEEWGIILGIIILLSFAGIAVYAVKCAASSRSAFYSIASVAAAGMILFQVSLNVFGVTDILPLTGVTLPFISRGGSSIISSWALLAFIKAADVRTYPKILKKMEEIVDE